MLMYKHLVAGTAAIALLVGATAVPAFADDISTSTSTEVAAPAPNVPGGFEDGWVVNTADGDAVTSDDVNFSEHLVSETSDSSATPTPSTGLKTGGGVQTNFLDFIQNWNCNVLNDPNYKIKTYTGVKYGGGNTSSVIDFFCGDSNSGYLHITQHAGEWQSRIASVSAPGSWDDVMDTVTRKSLQLGTKIVLQSGNKACYTTPVTLTEVINGRVVASTSFNPTVVVSNNNKKLITSYPSSVSSCK